jgi:hypothetical protein
VFWKAKKPALPTASKVGSSFKAFAVMDPNAQNVGPNDSVVSGGGCHAKD